MAMQMKLGVLEAKSDAHVKYYEEMLEHHEGMVVQYQDEIEAMKQLLAKQQEDLENNDSTESGGEVANNED